MSVLKFCAGSCGVWIASHLTLTTSPPPIPPTHLTPRDDFDNVLGKEVD